MLFLKQREIWCVRTGVEQRVHLGGAGAYWSIHRLSSHPGRHVHPGWEGVPHHTMLHHRWKSTAHPLIFNNRGRSPPSTQAGFLFSPKLRTQTYINKFSINLFKKIQVVQWCSVWYSDPNNIIPANADFGLNELRMNIHLQRCWC